MHEFSGGVDFDSSSPNLKISISTSISLFANLAATANASTSYSHSLYSYSPATFSASVPKIPDILSVGPYLEFSVGIEFGVSASVNSFAETTFNLMDGNLHLDIVNNSNTNVNGWTPNIRSSS